MPEIVVLHHWPRHSLLIRVHRLIRDHIRTSLHLHLLVEHHTLIALLIHVSNILWSVLRIHCILLCDWIHSHHLRTRPGLLLLLLLLNVRWSRILPELHNLRLLNNFTETVDVAVLIIRNEAVITFLVGHVEKNENLNIALRWREVNATGEPICHYFRQGLERF